MPTSQPTLRPWENNRGKSSNSNISLSGGGDSGLASVLKKIAPQHSIGLHELETRHLCAAE